MSIENPTGNEGIQPKKEFPEIAEEIKRMVAVDQEMREKNLGDDAVWDEKLDRRNTEAMKRIVAEIGWPTASKVGREVSESAWLLVQHADHDLEFQQHCLDLMKVESSDEVSPVNVAYLEDRVRVNAGRGQMYGTQFQETKDDQGNVIAYGPRQIENPENLDQRRASIGLPPHAEYLRSITEKYYPSLLKKE